MKPALPHRTYESLRVIAEEFLDKHHPSRSSPVPIEDIADLQFKIHIFPIPGLRDQGADGFLSSDMTEISIDEFCYQKRPARTRFTIAHELSCSKLFREAFRCVSVQGVGLEAGDKKAHHGVLHDGPRK